MPEADLKKTIEQIMANNRPTAKIIGVVFETYRKYIEQRTGDEGLKKVEAKMAELGHPFYFKDIRPFEYYPLVHSISLLVVIRDTLGWTDQDIFDMGYTAPQFSLLIRLVMRYFVHIESSLARAQENWSKHFTEGTVAYDLDKANKRLSFRVVHDAMHPLTCVYAAGYFLRIFSYVLRSPQIKAQEPQCMLNGAPYHEYLITW